MPSAAYRPREPQETLLWRVVGEHLGDFLEHARAEYAGTLPKYVKDAFSKYLTCGDLSRGFVRLHCDGCGDEVLVAFSCKQRGVCPSCAARRMSNEAAHIADRVFPNVPIRQWVMSMPMELRALAALDPRVLRAMNRIFCEEVSRRYRRACGADSQTGAVACVQRFGGSLNLNVHMHNLFLDGGFVDAASPCFIEAPPPTLEQLHALVVAIHARALKWLRKAGYLNANGEPHEPSALHACTQLALSAGTFLQTTEPDAHEVDERKSTRSRRFSAQHEGFDVHCGVRVEKNDDEGRERLVRYCTRPVLALDRLAVLPDGTITYRVKYPRRGRTHRTMTPVEFLARLAALVPPPRYPLVRYSGVLGPGAKLRARIVPNPTRTRAKMCGPEPEPLPPRDKPVKPEKAPRDDANASLVLANLVHEPEITEWNILTLPHWNRLANGALVAATPTIDWRTLLARTFGFDAMRCPRCGAPLRVMATITDRDLARAIVDHVRNARAPPVAA